MENLAFFVLLVLMSSACIVFVHGQSTDGFISIDCGKPKDYSHVDTVTGITYTSDFQFVKTGEIHRVASEYQNSKRMAGADDLRCFPNGTRNCYTVEAMEPGAQYLVRAWFMYGNYDGLDQLPEFDLYLGVNLWLTVTIKNASQYYSYEMITIANSSKMSVCLVNTGSGTPFISALELRRLPMTSTMYPNYTSTSQSLRLFHRGDVGGTTTLRYPADHYDRIWLSFVPQGSVSIASSSSPPDPTSYFDMPPEVMKTAVTVAAGTGPCLNFTLTLSPDRARQVRRFYVVLGFMEVQPPEENQTPASRAVYVYLNDRLWDPNIITIGPALNKSEVIYDVVPKRLGNFRLSICEATGSLLPSLLNAFEIQEVIDTREFETYTTNVDAIVDIQIHYKIQKNWNGEPCSPKSLLWDGLECNYDITNPRIIALNLSLSGMSGNISESFGNLTQLQSLDLSRNNLTGLIPDFLGSLPHLTYLNLEGNGLIGPIPKSLSDRCVDGSLTISVKGNPYFGKKDPDLCKNPDGCQIRKNENKKLLVAILLSAGFILVFLTLILIAIITFRRRRKQIPNAVQSEPCGQTRKGILQQDVDLPTIARQASITMISVILDSKQFSYEELLSITKNFSLKIGEGGSGSVYQGVLKDGMAVAVKVLSQSSPQGVQSFQTEAQVLTRIHHKNLVPLIGYCNAIRCLALLYEYMPEGSLEDHFSGRAGNISALCWKDRVNIAIDAAQGLENLHKGCRPAIIHRDVKSSNILLTKNFEARISDFGLSKVFPDEHYTHVSTRIMGTLGYLDPEYYTTYRLTEKSDVYGFGVVLLELITGLPAIVGKPEKVHLVQRVKAKLKIGDVSDVVDERLQGDYNVHSMKIAIQIALACTMSASSDRPMMGEVLVHLKECLDVETGPEVNRGNSGGTSAEIVPSGLMECPSAR